MFRRVVITIGMIAGIAPTVQGENEPTFKHAVVIPQAGVFDARRTPTVRLESVKANIACGKKSAETTLTVTIRSTISKPSLCTMAIPVPESATVRRVDVTTVAPERKSSTANRKFAVLTKKESQSYLRMLSEKTRTTSAIEFLGMPLATVDSIALPAKGHVAVRVQYSEPARSVGQHRDYLLPRSERLAYRTPWTISASLPPEQNIAGVYSPSHPLKTKTQSNGRVTVAVSAETGVEPGPFRLTWLTGNAPVVGTVFAFPPRNQQDGYFLWLLQGTKPTGKTPIRPQEITLVIDQSASMRGDRLSKVRSVANTVIKDLKAKDSFNVITYNNRVKSFSQSPVSNTLDNAKLAQTFLKNIQPGRGADYFSALEACLKQPASKDRLPIVLFFTDGMPTSGNRREDQIRKLAQTQNKGDRRIYAFSLGTDVNSPLLQRLANDTGGKATFVLPGDDVAKAVTAEVKRLQNPVLTNVKLANSTPKDRSPRKDLKEAVYSVLKANFTDLFAGDQIVILGRYRGLKPITLSILGRQSQRETRYAFTFHPKTADDRNTFIPRLWASRRIAQLVEQIRQSGATAKSTYSMPKKLIDPTVVRLSQEILKLTAEQGVVTEYTAFLCNGTTTPFQSTANVGRTLGNFDTRAVRSRAGKGAVNQEYNNGSQIAQSRLNIYNRYWNADMTCVTVGFVQQIGDTTFFRRGNQWVEGQLLAGKAIPKPKSMIAFGTAEYWTFVETLRAAGRSRILSLNGDLLLQHNGHVVQVTGPRRPSRSRSTSR